MKTLPDDLVLPPHTIEGPGKAMTLLTECAVFGPRGILVHGSSMRKAGIISAILASKPTGLTVQPLETTGGEPTLDQADALLKTARQFRPDWIAAIGGGSVIDLGKTCAGLLDADKPVEAYHDGAPLPVSHIPFAAVPATAGTGSEATIVCVLTNTRTGVKKSFRHPSLMPRLVILDPELLASCPPAVIAAAGMDAFTQAIEAFVSKGATWFSDQLALEAVRLISLALPAVFERNTAPQRARLMTGSYLAGLAFSNARLGLVHGLAHPLGSIYHQPHGLVCAVCLPAVLRFNLPVIGDKYGMLSSAAGGNLLAVTDSLLKSLSLANPFAGQSIRSKDLIIRETLASGSTKANPRPVIAADVEQLLSEIFTPG